MSTNRELYFRYKKEGISDAVIYYALEEINGYSHVVLTANFDEQIKDENRFIEAMDRYLNGEMIEYIFNKAYFLGKPFYVDNNVLIPRQETEQLVLDSIQYVKDIFGEKTINIADVCTGSGAIGLSVAESFKNNKVIVSDISPKVLEIAKKNGADLANVTYLEGDMLKPIIDQGVKLDVLLCNPPYIEDISTIDKKTWEQEPHLALLAKPCTYFYEQILMNYQKVMNDKFFMGFEIGEDMEEAMTALIRKYCPDAEFLFKKDIYNRTRFVFIFDK